MPSRSPNHPELVGIAPILLENPGARPVCDWDRKNPNLKTCSDFFIQLLKGYTKMKLISRKCKKLQET